MANDALKGFIVVFVALILFSGGGVVLSSIGYMTWALSANERVVYVDGEEYQVHVAEEKCVRVTKNFVDVTDKNALKKVYTTVFAIKLSKIMTIVMEILQVGGGVVAPTTEFMVENAIEPTIEGLDVDSKYKKVLKNFGSNTWGALLEMSSDFERIQGDLDQVIKSREYEDAKTAIRSFGALGVVSITGAAAFDILATEHGTALVVVMWTGYDFMGEEYGIDTDAIKDKFVENWNEKVYAEIAVEETFGEALAQHTLTCEDEK